MLRPLIQEHQRLAKALVEFGCDKLVRYYLSYPSDWACGTLSDGQVETKQSFLLYFNGNVSYNELLCAKSRTHNTRATCGFVNSMFYPYIPQRNHSMTPNGSFNFVFLTFLSTLTAKSLIPNQELNDEVEREFVTKGCLTLL